MSTEPTPKFAEDERDDPSQKIFLPPMEPLSDRRESQTSGSQVLKRSLVVEEEIPFVQKFLSVEVDYPIETNSLLFSHMVYKIRALWGEEWREVRRRYSNIHKLRHVIRVRLPFTVVFPAHYKNYVAQKNGSFLADRTEEINYFFRYLIYNGQKFASIQPVLEVFFNPAYDEKTVGKRLSDFSDQLRYAELVPIYRQLTLNCEFSMSRVEKRKLLDKFEESLKTSLDFFDVNSKAAPGNVLEIRDPNRRFTAPHFAGKIGHGNH